MIPNQFSAEKQLRFLASYANLMELLAWDQRIKKILENLDHQTQLLLAVRDHSDKEAFRQIFHFFAPKLNGFLRKKGLSNEAAEDVLQTVFISIWQKAKQFDETRANASAWIYQIARNAMIDNLRKDKHFEFEAIEPQSDQIPADEQIAFNDEVKALNAAIAALDPKQREAIELAYLGELSHSKIQAELNLPLGTIKSRIRLGLSKLKHELKKTDYLSNDD